MKTLAKATLRAVNKLPDAPAPSLAYLKKHWTSLSGELGGNSAPYALGYRRGKARLTLACSGGEALRLQHLKPQLMDELNRRLEAEVIVRIDFVHRIQAAGGEKRR